jgi:hypothetical protein
MVRLNDQRRHIQDRSSDAREGAMGTKPDHGWSWWYLLLLAQFVPALWVPFYNAAEPSLLGMPFFYWYQLVLVFVCAAVTAVVYWLTQSSQQQ